jgi:hypothetical protein
MRLYSSIVLDEFDHFEAEVLTDDEPPNHGIIRLREFSIQGEAATLRRLAAAAMNAADLADKAQP